jgi:hypothetical protein
MFSQSKPVSAQPAGHSNDALFGLCAKRENEGRGNHKNEAAGLGRKREI